MAAMKSEISNILEIRFCGAHFEKMAKMRSESQFFSGNITNMIPESPLNKMVLLMEDHDGVGGCMRTWLDQELTM